MEDLQTLDTNPGEYGVDSSEGVENVVSDSEDSSSENETAVSAPAEGTDLLARINEATGKKGPNAYKSLDEALEGVKNLSSLVGKKTELPKPQNADERYGYTATQIFELKHPEAAEHLDVLLPYARSKRITLDEAWDTKFADLFTVNEPTKDTVIKPSRRVPQAAPQVPDFAKMSDSQLKDNYTKLRAEEDART